MSTTEIENTAHEEEEIVSEQDTALAAALSMCQSHKPDLDERIAAVVAKVKEMQAQHGEESRRLRHEVQQLRRRNRELELRLAATSQDDNEDRAARDDGAEAPSTTEDPETEGGSLSEDSPMLKSQLRDAQWKVQLLSAQLEEVQKRWDETQTMLEDKLENQIQLRQSDKLEFMVKLAKMAEEMDEIYKEQAANEWALTAQLNYSMDMERDHRNDASSFARSKMDKELRQKTELIEQLKEAVAKRDRNIAALNAELKEAREGGSSSQKKSSLENHSEGETELFSQLHQALGVSESPSQEGAAQPHSASPKHTVTSGTVPIAEPTRRSSTAQTA